MKRSTKNFKSIFLPDLKLTFKYHSPERTPVIEVSTSRQRKRDCQTVQDNGVGLDPGQMNKLFIMFKRLHTHVEGSGVDLTMVKRIVENKNGKIVVNSEAGKGTTFTVQF